MNNSFVYQWTDIKTKKMYIGVHKGSPIDGYICSQDDFLEQYNSRPNNEFIREIIGEYDNYEDAREIECRLLEWVDAAKNPKYYNKSNSGIYFFRDGKHSVETKQKMSNVRKGVPKSEDHKQKISKALKGKQNFLGKKISKEHKEKISEANKGRIVSEETKKKLSQARKKRITTEETRKKLSVVHKGKKWYNNGKIETLSFSNISGFIEGRL
jgi:hypothetical protein